MLVRFSRGLVPFLAVLALLVVALPAWADEPWTEEELDPKALTEARDETKEQLAALAGKEDADAALKGALEARVKLLDQLLGTLETEAALPSADDLAQRRKVAEEKKSELQCAPPPAPPTTAPSEDEVKGWEKQAQAAKESFAAADAAFKALDEKKKALEVELKDTLPARLAAVTQALTAKADEAAGEAATTARENLRLEQRTLQVRMKFAGEALTRWTAELATIGTERDVHQLARDEVQSRFELGSQMLAKALEEQAEAERKAAEEAEKQAALERDPVMRFKKRIAAQREKALAELKLDRSLVSDIDGRLATQEKALQRIQREREQLARRFEVRGGVSDGHADRLLAVLRRTARSREVLKETRLPAFYAALERFQNRRAAIQDRIWDLEMPQEENEVWQELVASLENGETAESPRVRQTFNEALSGSEGLVPVLKDRLLALEDADERLAKLEGDYTASLAALDELNEFILTRIYWVRSDPPLSLGMIQDGAEEAGSFFQPIADADVTGSLKAAYDESPGGLLGALLGVIAAITATVVLQKRLRKHPAAKGSGFVGFLQQAGGMLLVAALPPALLYVVAWLLGLLALPAAIITPLTTMLTVGATIWLVRRLGLAVFSVHGMAVLWGQMPPDLAAQLRGAVQRITSAAFLLFLPGAVLRGEPFAFVALPRFFHTAFLVVSALVLIGLVRRKRPLIQRWTARSPFWQRASRFLVPIFCFAVLGVVAMDILGYRVGAGIFMKNLMQTMLLALLLGGFYVVLHRTVQRIASRVRARSDEERPEELRRMSATVLSQLTRVSMAVVGTTAVLLLADFWNLDAVVRGFFGSVQITEVGEGVYLTLWDVMKAIFYVVAAHFLVSNLSGVFEFLVFPLIGSKDAGGKYVLLAFSRYAIFLVCYSAALLSLHFSFSSLGWLLAAASVGLGFGLQEIVANFVSGIILLLERPIRVGDFIAVGNTSGTVDRINVRATQISTPDKPAGDHPQQGLHHAEPHQLESQRRGHPAHARGRGRLRLRRRPRDRAARGDRSQRQGGAGGPRAAHPGHRAGRLQRRPRRAVLHEDRGRPRHRQPPLRRGPRALRQGGGSRFPSRSRTSTCARSTRGPPRPSSRAIPAGRRAAPPTWRSPRRARGYFVPSTFVRWARARSRAGSLP